MAQTTVFNFFLFIIKEVYQYNVLAKKVINGVILSAFQCDKIARSDWFHYCPDGQKLKPLKRGYFNEKGMKNNFKIIFYNDTVYEGSMRNDNLNGYGHQIWSTGDSYKGNWKNGQRSSFEKFTWFNKSFYEGNWKNDVMHGQGKFVFVTGEVKEGIWEKGSFMYKKK